jgi:heme a synthase
MLRAFRWLAAATTVGMLLVLVMGAAVTNTGSAQGCGRSWPLCNGQFVPEFTVSSAIEYSHRAVTGVESVLVVALSAGMLVYFGLRNREVVVLAVLMLATLLLQAGLGAAAVLVPQTPLILASHFGVSLAAFAATYLSTALVFEGTRGQRATKVRSARVQAMRLWTITVSLYVLGVVYLGAYVRHAGLSLACADWPLCNGQLVPVLDGPSGVVFAHRLAALGVFGLLALLYRLSQGWGMGRRAIGAALGLCGLQILSGALVVWTQLGLFSTLAHAGIMALLFAALAHLVRAALKAADGNKVGVRMSRLSDEAARTLRLDEVANTSPRYELATTSSDGTGCVGRGAVADNSRGERAEYRRPTAADEQR